MGVVRGVEWGWLGCGMGLIRGVEWGWLGAWNGGG